MTKDCPIYTNSVARLRGPHDSQLQEVYANPRRVLAVTNYTPNLNSPPILLGSCATGLVKQ